MVACGALLPCWPLLWPAAWVTGGGGGGRGAGCGELRIEAACGSGVDMEEEATEVGECAAPLARDGVWFAAEACLLFMLSLIFGAVGGGCSGPRFSRNLMPLLAGSPSFTFSSCSLRRK